MPTLKPGGKKSGAPAVRGIVAEIDPFCNGKLEHVLELSQPNQYKYVACKIVIACPNFGTAEELMRGTMMDFPLTLTAILERAGKQFSKVEIVSRRPDRSVVRSNYRVFSERARKLASALTRLGLQPGDRVASMMWNHAGHLEAFFGVPCAGGILHTLNLRLHPDEITGIARHANDRFLLIDDVLLPVFEKFRNQVPFEKTIVVPYGCNTVPAEFLNYEELLEGADADFVFPKIDENDGATMCFTSGTTGFSKGVIYSHRALVLHSLAECATDAFAVSHHDTILPIAPMFHANAWGLPYSCAMAGSKLLLSGPNVEPEGLLDWMVMERVTMATGVPTVWIGVLDMLEKHPQRWKFDWPVRVICGGTAPPLELIRKLDGFGIRMLHLWGMTETTPLATTGNLKSHMRDWNDQAKYQARAKQGWPVPFVELRITRPSENQQKILEAPWDGETPGELEVRGPWVAAHYYESPDQAHRWTEDGWFKTGDVATVDEDGVVKIVDRAKDLVKSGGEWISSVDLENALMGHPAVKEACVVGIPHPKWQERPLAAVVLKDGKSVTEQELRIFLGAAFAKWQLPDAFVFVDSIPRTSVGKFKKIALREQFATWKWDLTE
jgi:fatty-acyl-CoA synthase